MSRRHGEPVYAACRRCGHIRRVKPERQRTGLCWDCYRQPLTDQPRADADTYTAAACIGKPAEWFFPPDDVLRSGVRDPYAYGRRLCVGEPATGLPPCPVRERCLADVMRAENGHNYGIRHGMFGGYGPRERARLDDGEAVA